MITKNNFHISEGNAKTGKIPSFNLLPGVTCSAAAKVTCFTHGCYAVNDLRYATTRKAWGDNTEGVKNNLIDFISDMNDYFSKLTAPRFFRIHSSGDFMSVEYAKAWYQIAKNNPGTKFLAFTKQFDIIRQVPFYELNNFSLVLSSWNGRDIPADLELLYTVAYCDDGIITIDSKKPLIECPGNCDTCGVCWSLAKQNMNVCFYKHGAKKGLANE